MRRFLMLVLAMALFLAPLGADAAGKADSLPVLSSDLTDSTVEYKPGGLLAKDVLHPKITYARASIGKDGTTLYLNAITECDSCVIVENYMTLYYWQSNEWKVYKSYLFNVVPGDHLYSSKKLTGMARGTYRLKVRHYIQGGETETIYLTTESITI